MEIDKTQVLITQFASRFSKELVDTKKDSLATRVNILAREINYFASNTGLVVQTVYAKYLESLKSGNYNLLCFLREFKTQLESGSKRVLDHVDATILEVMDNGIPSNRVIEEEVRDVLRLAGTRIFESEDDIILEVKTNPIELEDPDSENKVPLGEMLVQFSLNGLSARVVPVNASYALHSKYFHPHVAISGDICEGEAGEAITQAIESARLVDLFDIISSLLNTYNPHSPYKHIVDWQDNRFICCECGDPIPTDDEIYCAQDGCDHTMCESCLEKCEVCESYFCSDHMRNNICDWCKEHTEVCVLCDKRTDEYTTCTKCECTTCYDCANLCDRCQDKSYCDKCMELYSLKCKDCGICLCESCLAFKTAEEALCSMCEMKAAKKRQGESE